MNQKQAVLITLIAVVLVGSGWLLLKGGGKALLNANQTTATTVNTPPDPNAPKHYKLVISKDAMQGPTTLRVAKGVPIRIDVSAIDEPETDLSIQAFNLNTSTQGGSVSNFDFTPDKAGSFDIRLIRREAESDKEGTVNKVIGQLVVE